MTSALQLGTLDNMSTLESDTPSQQVADTVASVIGERRTTKRFVAPEQRHIQAASLSEAESATLKRMLRIAGQAPFHKPAAKIHCSATLSSPVPWRFHVVERGACTRLVDWLEQQAASGIEPWPRAWASKIPALLSAAGAAVLVTWLPAADPAADDTRSTTGGTEFSLANIEIVAAAGAAVQNLMLMAQAEGWDSYWSSGGSLREPDTFDHLGMARIERLLGAIMLTPRDHPVDKSIGGGLFDKRGDYTDWTRYVDI